MTTPSTEDALALSARLNELGEKATAGPWYVVEYGDGDSLAIHYSEYERLCFMATPGDSPGAMKKIAANAAFISVANPQAIRTLHEALVAATAENGQLRLALAEESFGAGYGCGWGDACNNSDYNPRKAREHHRTLMRLQETER